MQVKHNKQSTILQDAKLEHRLIAYGWSEESIIKIDTDQGKSGQKWRDERKGLDQLYWMIEHGNVGAVAAFDASRLYRDLTRVNYTDFVHMCEQYYIPVITFDAVYWPDKRQDMDKLIEKFAEAARFIDDVVYGKLLPAKLQAIEDAMSYGGGSVPFGFLVKETEDRKFFVVYEPHAQIIRRLFQRFRELGGNLSRLGRECREKGIAFPAFSGVEKIPCVSLRFIDGEYPVRTRDALVSILTNPAYIGWYVYDGVLVSKEAHEPIVAREDFDYAYNRLSATTLDGETNENKPAIDRHYGVACDALLEGILESDGNPAYVIAYHQAYRVLPYNETTAGQQLN
jgi:hypothetical protein